MNKHSLTTTIELHNEVCLQQSDGSMLLQKVSAGFSVQGLWISRSGFYENIITTVLYILVVLFLRNYFPLLGDVISVCQYQKPFNCCEML